MPPPTTDEVLLQRLREDLAAFTPDAVEAVLGPVAHAALGREQALPARRACRAAGDDPVATLLAVLVLGEERPRRVLSTALPRIGVDGAQALGLVAAAGAGDDDGVRALVDLRPYGAVDAGGEAAWWVASDLGELATGRALEPDHVLGIGGASTMLAGSTVRTPAERVLDLGTGCGVQALHALRHARDVVATDVSSRALAFARFTLALNGLPAGTTVDLREGSLLEPVAGDAFDLVVSNPPFVITPRAHGVPEYEYRDGGAVGDGLVHGLVTGVGSVLAPGGVAQLLANWEVPRGTEWSERVGGWLDEPGCAGLDAWVVQRELMDPAEYAELWIRDGGEPSGPRYDALYAAWLDDFATRGVEAIGFGLVTLRRNGSGQATLRRVEEHRGGAGVPLGEHLAAVLAAHDVLVALPDDALLDRRLVVAADVTQEQHHRPGEADPAAVLLRQTAGFGRVVQVSSEVAGVVGACDGDLTLGQITAGVAVLLDRGVGDVRAQVLDAVRGLAEDGFLTLV